MKTSVLFLFSLLLFSAPAEAQIFGNNPKAQVSSSEVPAEYHFTWKYTAKINTSQGNMDMIYRLKKDASYMGIEMPQAGNVFMVMDSKNDLMVMFMESGPQKMLMASRVDSDQLMSNEDFYKDAEVRKLDNKTLLGFNCQGYEVETKDHRIKFYFTNEADVSFTQFYQHEKNQFPPGLKEEWLKDGEGLMMEMQMVDKKNPKNNATMICTALEKESFRIKKSNYQSMYGN